MLLKVFSLSILCALKPSRVRIQSCHCKWETNKVANTDPYTIPANTEGRGVIGCWANQITAFQLFTRIANCAFNHHSQFYVLMNSVSYVREHSSVCQKAFETVGDHEQAWEMKWCND